MSFISVPQRQPQSQRPPVILQILITFLGGGILFFIGAGAISSAYRLIFSDRIFPGIFMAGVDLSSLTPEQASTVLNTRLGYPTSGQIVFRDGDHVWVATPSELGMVFDTGTSVQRAFGLGRDGGLITDLASQLNAWQGGIYLTPVIVFDARVAHAYLQNIANEIDKPVIEADLHLDGTQVVYTPGQTGRLVNLDKTLSALSAQLKSFRDGEITLVIEEKSPTVLDASLQADTLRNVLNGPLVLTIADGQPDDTGPWSIDTPLLAGMLSVGKVKLNDTWLYQISMDTQSIEQFLEQIAPQVNRSPENAHFYFDDGTRQLVLVQSAVDGRTLDVQATLDEISQNLMQGKHDLPLVINIAKAGAGDDATAASLGITSLVSEYTSYFRFSSTARMQNIKAAAARFYGVLVPPNTTFSMGDAIGDISLENGFAEALIIYNGQTITGVGGGVCQVSTTLFRTALYGGYPILERHEHAYRVLYYEQTANGIDQNLAGLDATVYFPLVDLKFTNDRPDWLLMETYFNADDSSLTWKFYSTDDGRKVDVQNLGLRNVVAAPDPLFEEDPDLPPDTCKQADYAADGADVTVARTVTLNGERLALPGDTIKTHYEPWQAVYQYGPGTSDPEGLVAEGLCH